MKFAVVDDEKIFRDRICELIDEHYNSLDIICTQFSNGNEILTAYSSGKKFDAVFLDIEMPGLDGMQTAERIRKISSDVPIVFLTSHTERAMDGYEVNAFRFLPKDVDKTKIAKTLNDLSQQLFQSKKVILKSSMQEYVVKPEDIVYAESNNNTVIFVTSDNRYTVRMKLSSALDMLNDAMPVFVKIHRCSVVNLSHVCGYTDKEVNMDNGEIIPVSKSCAAAFKKSMLDYIKHSAR